MPDIAFKRKLRWYIASIVDAMPDVAFERKLQRFSAWIVDAMSDVAFEWTCCVEKILLSLSYIPTEVTNLLGVDSRCPAGCSVPTELLREKDNTFSFRRSGGSNRLTLRA